MRQTVDIQDNVARVYFDANPREDLALTVHQGVQSADGKALAEGFRMDLPSTDPAPAVTIPIDGTILPDDSKLVLPFRAVNLSAVDLRVIKIYEDNVLLFLQENSLAGNSELRRVGRVVYSRQIPLTDDGVRDPHAWNDYSVDLSGLFKQEPGAIYRITLSFRQEYSLYGGKKAPSMLPVQSGKPTPEEEAVWDVQSTYWWDNYMDWEAYDWEDRNNPETPSYYMDDDRFPSINLLSSNLGLLAQYADGNTLWVAATDLGDAKPASGVDLEVYDFQLQRIGKGHTDGKGLAQVDLPRKPFILLGRKGKTTGYLRLADGYEKSMSRFDVGGQTLSKGLKGFIYGERGVWRPGDTLHVTMILADKAERLPEGHPATLELYTPEGQFYTRMVSTGQDGFYTFPIATSPDDPTGWWNAYVKVGGSAFHKSLHIETVKPNRLKVNLELPGDILQGGARNTARVTSSWLTGVPASGLRASATMTLSKAPATFKGFDGYTFRNPASSFENSEYPLFETTLDGNGFAETAFDLPAAKDAPGLLQAFIVTSVLESGGDESFTTQTIPYSPFPAYVGVKLPEGELETDKDNTVQVAVVDATGARLAGRELEYRVFKTEWSWWWDNNPDELAGYVNGRNAKPVASGKLTSGSQDVTFNLRAAEADWGRYLVVVRDVAGGHIAGKTVVIDWPAYKGRSGREDPSALSMLTFAADKESYRAGDKAKVYIPAAQGGQALVSLENAAGVIAREWVATDASKDTPYTFTVTPEMAPNFYVHITLVRPYEASEGGQPLRLYGVKRLLVENPASHLEPVIKVADTVAPEEAFTVQVSEKSGKAMTYTLAIVDEGLLDLTAFKTPSPWDAMYQTEALGVRTWDLYDEVIGAYAGRFSPMLSIGGDQENIRAARKDNRFNPVVKFLGPFTLAKGAGKHEVKLPMYVGSLRVMVVAGHDGAYGNAATTVTVKSPLDPPEADRRRRERRPPGERVRPGRQGEGRQGHRQGRGRPPGRRRHDRDDALRQGGRQRGPLRPQDRRGRRRQGDRHGRGRLPQDLRDHRHPGREPESGDGDHPPGEIGGRGIRFLRRRGQFHPRAGLLPRRRRGRDVPEDEELSVQLLRAALFQGPDDAAPAAAALRGRFPGGPRTHSGHHPPAVRPPAERRRLRLLERRQRLRHLGQLHGRPVPRRGGRGRIRGPEGRPRELAALPDQPEPSLPPRGQRRVQPAGRVLPPVHPRGRRRARQCGDEPHEGIRQAGRPRRMDARRRLRRERQGEDGPGNRRQGRRVHG